MGQSIIFAEFHPWNGPIKVGGHYYAERFAKDGWRVLWLENFLNWNRFFRRDANDLKYIDSWRSGISKASENVHTYTPFPVLPYVNLPILSGLKVAANSLRWCFPPLKSKLKNHEFDPIDILWISQPRMYSLINVVRYRTLVYRMFDNVQYFRGEPRSISDIEEAICRSADIVFATAHSLVEKAKKLNERVVYLPNGADTEKFDIPEMDSHPLDMFPHPRLIYIGAISDWFDFKLLAQAASQRPDWSFVLVGPLTAEAQSETALLNSLPNIHLMGWCDPKQVPAYLNHADVGLIPFRINSLTHSVSPIKLYEYCAAGLPVVAPRLHEIVESKLPSYFYVDLQGFIRAIEEGLRNRDRLRPKLLEFGRKNSWDMRYETVCENLTTL